MTAGRDDGPRDPTRDLIDAARQGDDSAWRELDARFRRTLSRIAHSRRPPAVRGRVGTEDVVQSTLLSAYRGLHTYEDRGSGSFLSWLKTILRNRVAERVRSQSTQRRDPRLEQPLGEAAHQTPAVDPSPSGVAERAEVCSRLLGGIAALPSDVRGVIVMHFFEGLSTRRVAERLGTSDASVRRRIGRGLELLKRELGAPSEEGRPPGAA